MYKKEKAIIDGMSKKKKLKAWAQLNSYKAPKGLENLQEQIDREGEEK